MASRPKKARRKAGSAPRPASLAPRKPKKRSLKGVKRKKLTRPKGTTCTTRRVRTKSGKRRTVKVCRRKPAKKPTPATGFTPTPTAPGAGPAPLPPPAVPPAPPPAPSPGTVPPAPADLSVAGAQRLLWRAGFGPRPGQAEQLAALGLDGAVAALVRPSGEARLEGPEPRDEDGNPLAPADFWGHDHCWWLDRMVRTDQPLVERMTLVWHDWFATSTAKVGSQRHMLDQNALLRRHALGSFRDLLRDITTDPAMLVWLDGLDNSRWRPNENFAREVMELFTLGAGRGAYTEQDVREAARAFTGFTATWQDGVGFVDFRFSATRHDTGTKTIFGQTGAWGWEDVIDLCLHHPMHASFFVTKLWSSFVPVPPDEATQAHLQQLYTGSGFQIAPVVEAILRHPALHHGPAMTKPPVVFQAGLLRAMERGIDTDAWAWLGAWAGQLLFQPPDVSGWDDDAWLDTSSWGGRWFSVMTAVWDRVVDPWSATAPYDATETPEQAVQRVLAFFGIPRISPECHEGLLAFARDAIPADLPTWAAGARRGMRQNALRLLLLSSADLQTC